MKILRLLIKRETRPALLALLFASVACVGLVASRIALTRNFAYTFLVWNLLLAWMPLLFALLARERFEGQTATGGGVRDWRLAALAGAWLLFLPNAPYICTDIIHLWLKFSRHFWIDLSMILVCAITGLVLGFISLYIMQSLVARRYGRAASWLFVLAATGLSSFGVYLGRFLRLNSWDIVLKPLTLLRGLDDWADGRASNRMDIGFMFTFATFLFVAYVMLHALTHLPRGLNMQTETPARA